METAGLLLGPHLALRPATPGDRLRIYEWLAQSDTTPLMMGPPTYPDTPVPTWEEFLEDYQPHYFDGSQPEEGRCFLIVVEAESVGQINYNDIRDAGAVRRVELDLWLRSLADCGRGYGPEAMEILCRYLNGKFGVTEFLVQPSARNLRAIRAYEKMGFAPLDLPREVLFREWGPPDYADSVYLVRRLPHNQLSLPLE